ncbi:uncharacterized protein LOC125008209 [Mugil cephalus]|uniref:uncharacterized protein LOC125008209 n=1 Tax=Mugil cephalus TaxID=48193 RepID=UPI001FB6482A|nr:uncharacterized protein LOC125008209 [Mugil cephalus]
MIVSVVALILLAVSLIQTTEIPPKISMTVVKVGRNVTLQCPVSEMDGKFFSWYKQPLGYMVQAVATGNFVQQRLAKQFRNDRFKVTGGESRYFLTISNVSKEDEATYFCVNGTAYEQSFVTGIFLAVDDRSEQKSVYVEQSPGITSVQQGNSAILQCSLLSKSKKNPDPCPDENNVYWFRAGSGESHPSFIYTDHRNTTGEQKERSCVYRLSKTIQNSSDAGTYYCAVVTCGEILFGEGTKVETGPKLEPLVLGLVVVLACCVTVIAVLIYYVNQGVCRHCKGAKAASHYPRHHNSIVEPPSDMGGNFNEVNYAALDFSARDVKGVKKQRKKDHTLQECVYSAVNGDAHTHLN